MNFKFALAIAIGFLSGAPVMARPVVVELFTSQGCSSCPPAEAVLLDLATRQDVLALAFHVDYWDRLGWRDPFSSAKATARQSAYAASLPNRQIYTPQMVIDGHSEVVGSRQNDVLALIRAAGAAPGPEVAMTLSRKGSGLSIEIESGQTSGLSSGRALLVGFDPRRETAVQRGENAGRTIMQANVVRSVEIVADWKGRAMTLDHAVPPGESAALILQAADGRILGAATLEK